MSQKASIPKGTRDFGPDEVAKRNYIIDIAKKHFELFGFQPIETPSFENSETLLGKYGDEGDRLIYRILDSGEYFEKYRSKLINGITIAIALEKTIKKALQNINNSLEGRYYYSEVLKDILLEDSFQIDFYKWFEENLSQVEITDQQLKAEIISRFKKIDFLNLYLFDYIFSLEEIEDAENISGIDRFSYELVHYKILKNFKEILRPESSELSKEISSRALRYDLTVPFARYVVQHQNEIEFPFKRYQIQPVWRADRPQKGRFREFFQCDADVVGSDSLWQEVECIQLYDQILKDLNIPNATIKFNNRKVLSGIAETMGAEDKLIDFTVALDKLDKIGEEKVKDEMLSKGITDEEISRMQPVFRMQGSFEEKLNQLEKFLEGSSIGLKGVQEIRFVFERVSELGINCNLELDVTLARGLDYYTGAIFEVAGPEKVNIGSIGGGGRYDDLTGIFGLKNMSGIGISLGLDRIHLVLDELGLFPKTVTNQTQVLFINFGDKEALASYAAVRKLRLEGISAELFPDDKKPNKQLNYANKRDIPFVVLLGEEELAEDKFTLKNMKSGTQQKLSMAELISELKSS